MIQPDASGRIFGTTFPSDRAPEGSQELGDELPPSRRERLARLLARLSLRVLRVRAGDVIVVRGARPEGSAVAALVRAVNRGNDDDPVVIFLPEDCRVHVEGRKIDAEDRGGYRETATTGSDRGPLPERGVFTGVQDARDPPSDTTPRQ